MTEFHTTKAFIREEPRIQLVESLLRSLLDVVDLEFEGQPVRVDGFRLRNLDDWRTVHETSLQQNLGLSRPRATASAHSAMRMAIRKDCSRRSQGS